MYLSTEPSILPEAELWGPDGLQFLFKHSSRRGPLTEGICRYNIYILGGSPPGHSKVTKAGKAEGNTQRREKEQQKQRQADRGEGKTKRKERII